ncbi:hypothetical protein CTAYLR_009331 [Chrysophaeum taylorii]|uniref:Uncharacterized protein n=1 Tax=Chrysophaeum taylorii TaxID=2483200 RepID=A0AAD7UPF6_9STRA|nr:hypothetical protein CTAYLR_009331 [Chrysophaeum taylorii]
MEWRDAGDVEDNFCALRRRRRTTVVPTLETQRTWTGRDRDEWSWSTCHEAHYATCWTTRQRRICVEKIADGTAYIYARGTEVVKATFCKHLDLKSSNILLTDRRLFRANGFRSLAFHRIQHALDDDSSVVVEARRRRHGAVHGPRPRRLLLEKNEFVEIKSDVYSYKHGPFARSRRVLREDLNTVQKKSRALCCRQGATTTVHLR